MATVVTPSRATEQHKTGTAPVPPRYQARSIFSGRSSPSLVADHGVLPRTIVTSRGLYRGRTASYWAGRFRYRTHQLQAALARIKHLKRQLRRRHASAPTRTLAQSHYGVWDRLADCESGGNWAANTGNGFYGGLQFTLGTWTSHGGTGMPNLAGRDTQIAVAERVLGDQGWSAWPACSAELGLR